MKWYVVDVMNKYVCHEGTMDSCKEYVSTCVSLWGHPKYRYHLSQGSKQVALDLKTLRNEGAIYNKKEEGQ